MTADYSYDALGSVRRSTISSMIEASLEGTDGHSKVAALALSDLGIEADGAWLRVAVHSPKLSKLLKDTPWSGDGWSRHLINLPGAQEGKRRTFRGLSRRRTVEVPMALVIHNNSNTIYEVELPLESDKPW